MSCRKRKMSTVLTYRMSWKWRMFAFLVNVADIKKIKSKMKSKIGYNFSGSVGNEKLVKVRL